MSNRLVSVVIPCFNQGRYLDEAIESCLAQTHADIEVIAVNDGSTDATEERMRQAAVRDPRVRCVSTTNVGLGAARNRALAIARGAYVNFLDADDFLAPTKLERQLAVLESSPKVGLVLCDVHSVDEQGARMAAPPIQLHRLDDPDGLFEVLLECGLFPPHVPLVRRGLVERAGGLCEDRSVSGHADYLLWLTIAAQGVRIHVLDEALASYRRSSTSMSSDADHMSASRQNALALLAARFPERIARGIVGITRVVDDLRFANQVLAAAVSNGATADPRSAVDLRRLQFLDRLIEVRDRPIFIWGTGAKGRDVLALLRSLRVEPRGFIDSRPESWGESIESIPVSALGRTPDEPSVVIVASMYVDEIVGLLRAARVEEFLIAP